MKRFWIVLLLLGLIMAFSSTVFAADVKFGGEFYLQGWYNKNASLIDKNNAPLGLSTDSRNYRGATAFYTERLRVKTTVAVAKGLTLVTRFDALERKWMASRRPVSIQSSTTWSGSPGVAGTDQEMENIAFDTAYVMFATPIGLFMIGNIDSTSCSGTCYTDGVGFASALMTWVFPKGPWTISATIKKSSDGTTYSSTALQPQGGSPIGTGTDNDSDVYALGIGYRWKTGNAGFSFSWVDSRTTNVGAAWSKSLMPAYTLYFVNKFGKLYIGEEFGMVTGGYVPKMYNGYKVKPSFAFSNAFNVELDLAPAKLGGWFIYSRGDKLSTPYKKEGGFRSILDLDRGFNPCLILWDESYMQWFAPNWKGTGGSGQQPAILGNAGAYGINTYIQNVMLFQLYGDFKVTPKLNLGGSFTWAKANEPPAAGWVSKKIGYEADLTMKYKIYDNLEYMIGAGYLFTGDYFKGTSATVKLTDNYLITHKLTLTF